MISTVIGVTCEPQHDDHGELLSSSATVETQNTNCLHWHCKVITGCTVIAQYV